MFQRLMKIALVSLSLAALSGVAKADLPAIIIDQNALPYGLNPSNYKNSPSNYANSSSNYQNSESNYANSPSNYQNSSSNYQNGSNGQRKILNENKEFIGYYVYTAGGLINIFNAAGKRMGYVPGGDNTRSMFSDDGWCGTLGESNGRTVLGLTQSCYQRFLLDQ